MAKTINLGIFANDNIQKATLSLLADLGIRMEVRSHQQIPIPAVVAASLGQTPNEIQEICSKIAESYLAGIISEKTFTGNDNVVSFKEACENVGKYEQMMVFAVDFKKEAKVSRQDIAKLTRILNRASKSAPVVLVCRYFDEEGRLALSLCERTAYKNAGHTGEKAGKVNILRGINPSKPHSGHIRILEEMRLDKKEKSFESLYDKWFGVFDVNILTDQFYKELQNWFYWASSVIDTPLLNTQTDKQSFTVKLLARVIMCWYIKELRGANGENLIPNSILGFKEKEKLSSILANTDNSDFDNSSSYYFGILHNLFFNGFANYNDSCEFESVFVSGFDSSILLHVPYLNCSLFNKSNSDQIELNTASVPNSLFFGNSENDGLFKILCAYRFTIEENTPDEVDIALAPEMLGMVFENLLAEIDPRTKDKIRETIKKARGAYHTPDCILDEMVKDSLSRYLVSKLSNSNVTAEETKSFVEELVYHGNKTSDSFDEESVKALYSISVLDPACGSGSFPLNVLNNIDRILSVLDPDSELWKNFVLESIQDENKKNQRREKLNLLTQENNRGYTRKLTLLKNCIFGLDIQPLAILITRLRFYLSLMTEQKVNLSSPNFGIVPLPYLDTKFLCVDSLSTCKATLNSNEVQNMVSMREEYYDATEITEYTTALDSISGTLSNVLTDSCINIEKDGIRDWLKDPQQNLGVYKTSLLFPEVKNGFDIVIGNPPFGAIMSESEVETYKKEYSSTIAESAIFFILMAIRELKPKGILTFLAPKPMSYASNYKALREKLKNELTLWVDCGKAFKDVKFEQSIIGLRKGVSSSSYQNKKYDKKTFIEISNIEKSNIDRFELFLNDVSNTEILIANNMNDGSTPFGNISSNTRGQGLQSQMSESGCYPVYGGKEISRLGILSAKGFVNEQIEGNAVVLPDSLLFQNIVAHIENPYPHVKLIGCLAPSSTAYIVDTVNQIVVDEGYSSEYIWGLLNSKLLSWYVYCFIYGRAIRTMHFDTVATKRIPIKKTDDYSNLVDCVSEIHENFREGLPIKDLEDKLDMWVYKIYGLTYEQCLVIDPLLSFTKEDYESLN